MPPRTRQPRAGGRSVRRRASAAASPRGTVFEQAAIDRAIGELMPRDKRVARLLERFPPEPRPRPANLFANLCHTVCAQMLSNASARAIFGRLEGLCAGPVSPPALAAVRDGALREAGLSLAKIASLRALAEAFEADGDWFSRVHEATDEEVRAALTAIRGLGPWSAEMFLLFSLGRMDVYSARDAALATGLIKLKRLPAATPRGRLDALAARYAPYRSVLSLALWTWRHHDWEKL
jgi:DNA-3-methyladenine glycosylase II